MSIEFSLVTLTFLSPVKKVRKKQVLPPIHSPPVPRVKLVSPSLALSMPDKSLKNIDLVLSSSAQSE